MTGTLLVTGASGFVGSRVLAEAACRAAASPLRATTHRRPVTRPVGAARPVETVEVDLADSASLRGLCAGVRTVLHCASHVDEDPETCTAVNERGTVALVDDARRAGVSRIVYLSTTAVYGDGVYRGVCEGAVACHPASVVSRTRLAAEEAVLRAGGVVLRPSLVYGSGDRWFVPGVLRLLGALGGLVDGGRARLSLIDVDSLARVLVAAAVAPGPMEGVYHANHPRPIRLRTLCASVVGLLGVPGWTGGDLGCEEARRRVVAAGGRRRHLDMLAQDHWFESSRIWSRTGCSPVGGFGRCFAAHAPWYREQAGKPDGGRVGA